VDRARKPSERAFRTAQEVVVERLRGRILAGELRPGDRLLQAELADEMQTSTTPVREALWELAGAGLLDVDPHRGVIVHIPTLDELTDIYDLRVLLEPLAVSAAIDNITEDELLRAEGMIEEMAGDPDARAVAIHNTQFHEILVAASRRPRLTEILTRLNNVAMVYVVSNLYRMPGRVQKAIEEHRELLVACRARDKELAKTLMITHLRGTLVLSQEAFEHASGGDDASGGARTRRR
jgi:DNA-binding GntR family transcriptional regulator